MRIAVITAAALLATAVAPASAQSANPSSGQVAALILREAKTARDPEGWADDMRAVLAENNLPATRENICAGIAIIGQESTFTANPAVPGLGPLALKALHEKLDGYPVLGAKAFDWLDRNPPHGASFLARIGAAKTERDLDLTYRDLVSRAAGLADLGSLLQSGLFNRYVEAQNNITTAGSMQVSVAFALKTSKKGRWLPMSLADVYAVRDELYTRRGGMKYGLLQLLGYETGYTQKLYRFADYNAGRYASRNAAFQMALAELAQTEIAADGDLLIYDKAGKPLSRLSQSEKLLRDLIRVRALGISDADLRNDLEREKSPRFTETATFTRVRAVYRDVFGKDAPFAALPRITLSSVKLKHRMTTADFAARVNKRYQRCMAPP